MKTKGQAEKWVRVILGVVCLLLLVNLVMQLGGVRAGASRGAAAGGRRAGPALSGEAQDSLSSYDPVVRLDVLKKLQSRPLTQPARNPFQGPAPPRVEPAAPAPVAPPPPPPPVPLVAVGYTEKNGGLEAFVSDDPKLKVDSQQTYVVHEGETFAQRYRVLKLTPKFIEIEDESTHQTVQLPFP
jgi:hypothetical protein